MKVICGRPWATHKFRKNCGQKIGVAAKCNLQIEVFDWLARRRILLMYPRLKQDVVVHFPSVSLSRVPMHSCDADPSVLPTRLVLLELWITHRPHVWSITAPACKSASHFCALCPFVVQLKCRLTWGERFFFTGRSTFLLSRLPFLHKRNTSLNCVPRHFGVAAAQHSYCGGDAILFPEFGWLGVPNSCRRAPASMLIFLATLKLYP